MIIKKGTAIITASDVMSDTYSERHEMEISVIEKTTGNYTEILARKVRDEVFMVDNGVETLLSDDVAETSYNVYHGVTHNFIFNQYMGGTVTWTTPLTEV